ncbi:hypothetical protein [Xanthomonas campestris]|uniref:hypothetical protein n=1 Tax=Xanthomonas campestris TaxID=339 RepID=UPI0011C07A3A|nr:hypothetical protein [Xanthomonas campestris]MEA9739788.1 hypothetical protein [Xanthomonas campestris pv. raphani]MEA9844328.1 hypothetical protein [Xanthomonas campestris pv. raphani]MEA9949521.1 hypothetical protein [Xanthomonas campestris pv. raphani]
MNEVIDKRLNALKSRRSGLDRSLYSFDSAAALNEAVESSEAYQKRAPSKPYTRYTLGAMQEVGDKYNRVSRGESERVTAQLKSRLGEKGLYPDFRIQGSVPANIHIRGASDVDLLVLEGRFLRYDGCGQRAASGHYHLPYMGSAAETLLELRNSIEHALDIAYPSAKVDRKGDKSVKLSGGSLRRDVDIVPSSWYESFDYQRTMDEKYRGVHILKKSTKEMTLNYPFLHIQKLGERDVETWGNLKKAIRLTKNLKADAKEDGQIIQLSSFDIASLMWHIDIENLRRGIAQELNVLAVVSNWLNYLSSNQAYARTLDAPDGTRKILDSHGKFEALALLSDEANELASRVAREQVAIFASNEIEGILRKAFVP